MSTGNARSAISNERVAPDAKPSWRSAGLRYYKYSHFLRERFGGKVHRVTLDAGLTCPNVDGTVAVGGCVYCDNRSFSPARRLEIPSIRQQMEIGIAALTARYGQRAYLAYFQAATNTYAPVEILRSLYDEALADPRVVGLIVGTRPDCVPDDVLDLLRSYTDRWYVGVEYGLQSIHARSLVWMNRGHGPECYADAVRRGTDRGLDLCAHVILGLPGESRDDMLATVDAVARSGVQGIKIHNLHVVRQTPMELAYRQGRVPILEESDYLDLLIEVLERLPPEMVIHRVTGEAPSSFLVAPRWLLAKAAFLQRVEAEMARRDAVQGRFASFPTGT